jgi:hypothetical protein
MALTAVKGLSNISLCIKGSKLASIQKIHIIQSKPEYVSQIHDMS